MQGSRDDRPPPYFVNMTREGRGQFNWQFAGVPQNKIILHKVLSQKGLTENEAIADQCAAEMMPSLEILPARCATSPWVAMLRYDERQPFVSVTSTTTRTLWDLYQMQLYYISQAETARSMGNHRLCKQLMDTIQRDPEAQKLELYVKTALDEFLCAATRDVSLPLRGNETSRSTKRLGCVLSLNTNAFLR